MITGGEISTRIAHGSEAQLLQTPQHILTKTALVCLFRLRIINPFIHRPTDMFEKTAEQSWVNWGDLVITIQNYLCLIHLTFSSISTDIVVVSCHLPV